MDTTALEDDSECWPNREWNMEHMDNGVLQDIKELYRYVKILQAIYKQIHVIQNYTRVQTPYYNSQETCWE
jgi:hypothetical protein